MNLGYLLEKKHFSIESGGVQPARGRFQGEVALGAHFLAGENGFIRIRNASSFPHIASGVDDLGWVATTAGHEPARLDVAFVAGSDSVSREHQLSQGCFTSILAPSLLDLVDPFAPADLLVRVQAQEDIRLYTSRRVDRHALYRLARGKGIEIGPGPKPQIHNGPDVDVAYVEEKSAMDWLATYRTGASEQAWSDENYRLGKAHDLPVGDASLDFIFSSHVFEHLYNPLGHLQHWQQKLKPGGLVLSVVPSLEGTKDFVLPPTTLTQLMAEHDAGTFDVPRAALEQWVRYQSPEEADIARAVDRIAEERFSIHVHSYDSILANCVLRYAVEALGFSRYRVHYKKNSKDFAFVLQR